MNFMDLNIRVKKGKIKNVVGEEEGGGRKNGI
jgi:hypothetical protein